jgi:hypothetical protein
MKMVLLSALRTGRLREIQCVPPATEPGIEDIATKFEQEYIRCVRNEEECVCSAANCCDTEHRSANQW